jgi:hypothetical protein
LLGAGMTRKAAPSTRLPYTPVGLRFTPNLKEVFVELAKTHCRTLAINIKIVLEAHGETNKQEGKTPKAGLTKARHHSYSADPLADRLRRCRGRAPRPR